MSNATTLTANCPRCGFELHAADEDELVALVQEHVREDHGFERELPRKHILAYLRKAGIRDTPADPKAEQFRPAVRVTCALGGRRRGRLPPARPCSGLLRVLVRRVNSPR